VKCDNIFLGERALLGDFGLAADLDDPIAMTRSGGSPGYAPPEVVLGMPYNEKVDVFAAGVVFYAVLTDRLPFRGSTVVSVLRKTVRCAISFDHEAFHSMSGALIRLLSCLMDRNQAIRPAAHCAHAALLAIAQTDVRGRADDASRTPALQAQRPVDVSMSAYESSSHPSSVSAPPVPNEVRLAQPPIPNQGPPPLIPDPNALQGTQQQCAAPKAIPKPPTTPKPSDLFRWAMDRCIRPFTRSSKASSSSDSQRNVASQSDGIRPTIPTPPSQPQPNTRRPRRGGR